jgi:hypothetical protein
MNFKTKSVNLGFLDLVQIASPKYRKLTEYFIQLIPLIIISLLISLNQEHLIQQKIGSRNAFELLLATAIAAPWLAQACCMPLYIELGAEIYSQGAGRTPALLSYLMMKFVWPVLTLTTIVTLIFKTYLGFDFLFSLNFFGLCILQIFYSQFMVLPLTLKRWDIWLASWISYFMTLAIFPSLWLLPPFIGILTIKVLNPKATGNFHFKLKTKVYLFWLGNGLLVGLVLWFDKVAFYLSSGKDLNPLFIFISLIPSLLALNYFFIFRLPVLEKSLSSTISSINHRSIQQFMKLKSSTYNMVKKTFIEVSLLLIFFSIISCLASIYYYGLDVRMSILSHILTILLTLISMILNTMLLLRVFKLFFCMSLGLLFFFSLSLWLAKDYEIFYRKYLVEFILIALFIVLTARRKWKTPHLSYFNHGS